MGVHNDVRLLPSGPIPIAQLQAAASGA